MRFSLSAGEENIVNSVKAPQASVADSTEGNGNRRGRAPAILTYDNPSDVFVTVIRKTKRKKTFRRDTFKNLLMNSTQSVVNQGRIFSALQPPLAN